MTESIRGSYPTGTELDEIASSWRTSSTFRRLRATPGAAVAAGHGRLSITLTRGLISALLP